MQHTWQVWGQWLGHSVFSALVAKPFCISYQIGVQTLVYDVGTGKFSLELDSGGDTRLLCNCIGMD